MIRPSAILAVSVVSALALVGCGNKNGAVSLCTEVPPPAACMIACDPSPGAAATCPSGFYCDPDGHCDAQCTQGGGQCGDGTCTADGVCDPNPDNGDGGIDSACPDLHFTPMVTTPSIDLVLDRSGSMTMKDITPSRFQALQNGLFGADNGTTTATGAVTATQANVYFGEIMFAGDQSPCTDPSGNTPGTLGITGYSTGRALNNSAMLATLTNNDQPNGGSTPTASAIDMAIADFAATPPPSGSPPIILLATDGQPNSCGGGGGNGPSITAVKAAYTAGIQTFVIGLAGIANQYLQDVANAGTGVATGQNPNCTGCSPYYTADNAAQLSTGLDAIINGVLSCNLTISGNVDPMHASEGTVTFNGMMLTYGTDWTVNGTSLQLIGQACTNFKNATNPTLDAQFPCGAIIQ